jgi:hypothetical protein
MAEAEYWQLGLVHPVLVFFYKVTLGETRLLCGCKTGKGIQFSVIG